MFDDAVHGGAQLCGLGAPARRQVLHRRPGGQLWLHRSHRRKRGYQTGALRRFLSFFPFSRPLSSQHFVLLDGISRCCLVAGNFDWLF